MSIFSEIWEGFVSGNLAILTNACLLPLYPGLIAFLAGTASDKQKRITTAWLGILVLAGVLTMMIAVGFVLSLASASFGDLLPILLPIIYIIVVTFGVMMLMGKNPFAKLQTAQAPMLKNRYLTAYVYGLFFGPMTLPCTGPIIAAAFAVGALGAGQFASQMIYFLAFGIGFGWPLVVLPLLAAQYQRRIISFLGRHHESFTRGSGILLIAIGVFGFITELVPQIEALPQEIRGIHLGFAGQLIFWVIALGLALLVGWLTARQEMTSEGESQVPAGA